MYQKNSEVMLPRLNVAIFSLDNHLQDIANQLTLDRRFAYSKINVFGGGIESAIKIYQNTMTPNIIIVQLNGDISQMIGQLYALSEVCDSETHVIVAGKNNDVETYRELLRHGISDYFVLPTTTTGLISVISNLFQEKKAPLCPSVVFVGACGGVGSSIIAQSVAICLVEHFKIDTIYTDLDTAYPMSSLGWSLAAQKNIDLIVANSPENIDEAVVRSCLVKVIDNLYLLTAPIDPMLQWGQEDAETIMTCLNTVRSLADYSIVDIPCGQLTLEKRAALLTATNVVIVSEPTIKGIRNVGVLYESIQSLRPNDPPPKILFNKIDAPNAIQLDEKEIFDNTGIKADYTILYQPEVIDLAISRGVFVSSLFQADIFNQEIIKITNHLLGNASIAEVQHSILYNMIKDIRKTIGI